MSITETSSRIAHYTSSQIYRLLGSAAVQKTYIEEKKYESQLGVSCNEDAGSRASNWGTMMQYYVAEKYLPKGFKWHDKTEVHPTIKLWSGTADIISDDAAGDVKCFYRKKFAQVANCIVECEEIRKLSHFDRPEIDYAPLKKNHPEIYWQITSNAAILNKSKGLLIIFLPYESELEDVKAFAYNSELPDEWKYRFIYESHKSALPYQSDDSVFSNVIYFEWDIDSEDVKLIESKIPTP